MVLRKSPVLPFIPWSPPEVCWGGQKQQAGYDHGLGYQATGYSAWSFVAGHSPHVLCMPCILPHPGHQRLVALSHNWLQVIKCGIWGDPVGNTYKYNRHHGTPTEICRFLYINSCLRSHNRDGILPGLLRCPKALYSLPYSHRQETPAWGKRQHWDYREMEHVVLHTLFPPPEMLFPLSSHA